jgi:hypothetical protein
MYSRNIVAFARLLLQDGKLVLDFKDDIIRDTCVTYNGEVLHAATRDRIGGDAAAGTPQGESGAARSAT